MKRLHVHLSVKNIPEAVRFYSALFEAEPTVSKDDYAKWMLDDPRVNFAVSTYGAKPGLDHLGIQAEDGEELNQVYGRLRLADAPVLEQGEVTCCYARSEKAWITDPAGIPWETFRSMGDSAEYGDGSLQEHGRAASPGEAAEGACCTPSPASSCCG